MEPEFLLLQCKCKIKCLQNKKYFLACFLFKTELNKTTSILLTLKTECRTMNA